MGAGLHDEEAEMTIRVLDYSKINGEIVLLDGNGQRLRKVEEPVWLEYKEGELQRNSLGIEFSPQYRPEQQR